MDDVFEEKEAIRILKLTDRSLEIISNIIRAKILFAVPATAGFVVFLSSHHYDAPYAFFRIINLGSSFSIIVYTIYLAYFISFIERSRFSIVQVEFDQTWPEGLGRANNIIKTLAKLVSIEKTLWPVFTISIVSLLFSIIFKALF